MEAQPSTTQMRSMPPVQAHAAEATQLKEKVGPEAIPDAHVAYEYIAKLAYMDAAAIQSNPEAVKFLAKFGYSAATAQVIEGRSGFAMLYLPPTSEGANPPIIAFRGTQPTELSDLLADIDLSYIGEPQFTNNKETIESTLAACCGPAVILGHSLGGALAQKTSLEFSGLVKEVVTFQAPALGLAEKIGSKDREDIPKSTHHIAEHDLVDRAGLYRTPGEVFVHDSTLRPVKAHTTPLFGSSQFAEEREAFGISTTTNEKGEQFDGMLGHEIRQQDPEKKHIEQREGYPKGRQLSGLALETIRSAAGAVKTAGEVVTGIGKGIWGGVKSIGKGIGGLFDGDEQEERKPGRRGGPR